jgi:5-hydroxyisourate hydrolase-like protein (transthyretin family)
MQMATNAALLEGAEMEAGSYELLFAAGDYFRSIQSRLVRALRVYKMGWWLRLPFF